MMGVLPDDIDLFVRSPSDIPVTMKTEVMDILRKRNWKEHPIPDPTLLVSQLRKPAGGN
jgi:acetyl-CoA decarbonylase/synthase complex subunit alpha